MSAKSGLRQKVIMPLRLRGLVLIVIMLIILDSHTRSVYTWMSLQGSLWYTFTSTIWLYVLTVVEVSRQLWLYLCERSAKVNSRQAALMKRTRAVLNRSTTPVTRQRTARLIQRLIILAFVSAAAAKIDGSPHWWRGLIDLPTYVLSPQFLPYTIAIAGNMLLYVGIYWVMSRGGYDIYQPGQVKTRFSDVWGQDQVVDKVRETGSSRNR